MPIADQRCPRRKLFQFEGGVIELATRSGIGGKQNLKAAIQQEAVGAVVGIHAPADMVSRLAHAHLLSSLHQHLGAAQPGQPGPDNQDHMSPSILTNRYPRYNSIPHHNGLMTNPVMSLG